MTRSVMQNNFATVPVPKIPRSTFNLNSGLKTTFDADELIPCFVEEVLPNDSWSMNAQALIRMNSPTLHPLMDNLHASVHFWFVPYRMVFPAWEKMHGAQDDPTDTIAYTTPVVNASTTYNIQTGASIYSYMGMPWVSSMDLSEISALPFRAYYKIFNDWYKDQNLENDLIEVTGNGPDSASTAYAIQKRGKRYDYFTSALPSLQKGSSVSVNLGTSAVIHTAADAAGNLGIYSDGAAGYYNIDTAAAVADVSAAQTDAAVNHMYADLTTAIGPTLNDLRLSIATQRLLERDARSGTRYREHLLAHFGADNDDLRLQRPEFLGGGTVQIQINSVPNTSEDAAQKQGELTGYGMGSGRAGFTKTFKEWGVVLGIISVSADITYSQGVDKMWTKSTRYDYAYPILANIGEQSILDKEIWYNTADGENDDVWGYTPRYEEHRHKNSRLTGLMHVDHASTLASWHLSEDFTTRPSLDATFIKSNATTPIDRAIAIPSEPQFNADIFFGLRAARPLPLNGIPGLTRL